MKQKKVPMRRCIACYESKPKKELIRVVRNGDAISLDITGKMNGRGAYICSSSECFDKMIKSNKLSREFETSVSAETYEALRTQFEYHMNMKSDGIKTGGGAIG